MCTLLLPVVDWTDAPADLNELVRFAERRNFVSVRVPSHFNWPLLATLGLQKRVPCIFRMLTLEVLHSVLSNAPPSLPYLRRPIQSDHINVRWMDKTEQVARVRSLTFENRHGGGWSMALLSTASVHTLICTIHIPNIPECGSVLLYFTQCIHAGKVASRNLRVWRIYTRGERKGVRH
jgi:hypothetical protein